ncbi:hypothetical protein C8J56DRAFT_921971 [Mycena floridula]|nr:hypothetical protein C8J56DRAFT_921971 [Mycena floridula]
MCVYFSFDIVTRLRQQYSVIIYSFRAFSPLLVSYRLVISLAKGSACRFFNRSPLLSKSPCFSACFVFLAFFVYFRTI